MSPTAQLANFGFWSKIERRLAEMMVFVLDTNDLPSSDKRIVKRSFTLDLITCRVRVL